MAQIAWIEDDHLVISALVRLLEDDGHEILCYSTYADAMRHTTDILATHAIILDIILADDINGDPYLGVRVLEELREDGYQGPVVVCSRVQNPAVLEELNQLGVYEILRKPVRPSVLYKCVSEALMST